MNNNYLDVLRLQHCKFDSPNWCFESDSQGVAMVKSHLGKIAEEFDSFFIRVGDGDYQEVWGIHGIIPYLSKNAYQIV